MNAPPPPPPKPEPRSVRERISLVVQLALTLSIVGGTLVYLIWSSIHGSSAKEEKRPTPTKDVVEIAGPRLLHVRPGTPLDNKLHIASVEAAWLTAPILPVTGTTLASLIPGKNGTPDAWQFATPELLTAFADWQKAVTDITFQETQLKLIRDLNDKRMEAQKAVVARMVKLVKAGSDTEKDLAKEKADLAQFEIQGSTDIHKVKTDLMLAQRNEATLARQFQQAGLEPTMLRSAAAEGDIMIANVPERAMERVKIGMTCEVRFVALPGRVFTGKVSSISPVITREKRVLNVQFIVTDPENHVRPGMFAEIGLGTDKREALLMPTDGVLHVGDKDYALRETTPGTWQITEVLTGELRGANLEVLAGLQAGERVLGNGAILLKPVVVRALQLPVPAPSADRAGEQRGGTGG